MLEQHLVDVNLVLERLDVADLKVNVSKCAFAQEEVMVLRLQVSKHRINPNPAKVQGISDLRLPKDVLGFKQVLGMLYLNQKFIKYLLR